MERDDVRAEIAGLAGGFDVVGICAVAGAGGIEVCKVDSAALGEEGGLGLWVADVEVSHSGPVAGDEAGNGDGG